MHDNHALPSWLTTALTPFRTLRSAIGSRPGGVTRLVLVVAATILLGAAIRLIAGIDTRGFRYACELFAVFLWLACLAVVARGILREGLVVAASLVMGLVALEGLAVTTAMTAFPVVGKGFYAFTPELGWGASGPGAYPARKTNPQTGVIIYDVVYTIDPSRLRRTRSAPNAPTIAFFGDSFTFGEGVGDSETTPQAFADLADHRLRILNLGFPGYGPNQVLRALETGTFDATLGSELRLIVLTTAPWHAERTACKPTFMLRGPRYRIEGDGIAYEGACSRGLGLAIREWVQNTALYRATIEPLQKHIDRNDVELYIRVILATIEIAEEKYGAKTLVAYLPAGDEYLRDSTYTDASIVERLRQGGASIIDASLAQERAEGAILDIPDDGHPTAFAHHARAKALKAYIAEKRPDLLQP
jgi:hypothetical protein